MNRLAPVEIILQHFDDDDHRDDGQEAHYHHADFSGEDFSGVQEAVTQLLERTHIMLDVEALQVDVPELAQTGEEKQDRDAGNEVADQAALGRLQGNDLHWSSSDLSSSFE